MTLFRAMPLPLRRLSLAPLAASAVLMLGACGGGGSEAAPETTASPSATSAAPTEPAEPAETTQPTEPAPSEEPSSLDVTMVDADAPDWAHPASYAGDELAAATIAGKGLGDGKLRVTAYQAGFVEAPTDGTFAELDADEPKIKQGDQLVAISYVVENTGSDTVTLGNLGLGIWVALGKRDLDNADLFVGPDVVSGLGLDDTFERAGTYGEILPIAPGEAISKTELLLFEPGKQITFEYEAVPSKGGEMAYDDATTSKPVSADLEQP